MTFLVRNKYKSLLPEPSAKEGVLAHIEGALCLFILKIYLVFVVENQVEQILPLSMQNIFSETICLICEKFLRASHKRS
ncbi:hypothetical protein CTL2C_215 [Chlamydia trachomatis L2c]|nr:hypothetical protein CTL2C_215 [Chlamydia trachomatis L2c]